MLLMRTIIKKKEKNEILIYYNSAILNVSKYIYIFPNYVLNRLSNTRVFIKCT